MKKFDIPNRYKSSFISEIKELRKESDPRKKDFSPSILDFGPVQFHIARHFGFCYGVENAIERAYKAVEENPGKRIFLLSQMIHNPTVNANLQAVGIKFIMDTSGKQIIPWSDLKADDLVLIPAFGTTLAIEEQLIKLGIEIREYDTTCPFVTKVWKQSEKLGKQDHTIIIHGKPNHEETRATFSHSNAHGPAVVVCNMEEAISLSQYLNGKKNPKEFKLEFGHQASEGFDPETDLKKIGVVNQTTMLAQETQAIADFFKTSMIDTYGNENLNDHFADTRDTLCYATNDNQQATFGLLEIPADLAIIVGGYNSSNTSHLVELCEEKLPSFFISGPDEILSKTAIKHYDFHNDTINETKNFLPEKSKVKIILSSGASCPDAIVDEVLSKLLRFFPGAFSQEEVLAKLQIN